MRNVLLYHYRQELKFLFAYKKNGILSTGATYLKYFISNIWIYMQRNIVVIRMYFVSLNIMKECREIISIFYFYNYVKTIEKLFICTV